MPGKTELFNQTAKSQLTGPHLLKAALVSAQIQKTQNILDLGCGNGFQLSIIAELNPKKNFTGIDLSKNMLSIAKTTTAHNKNLSFRKMNMCELEYPDASFDAVISTITLHHLPTKNDLRKCFLEIKRVLKPNGQLCLIDLGKLKSSRPIKNFTNTNNPISNPYFHLKTAWTNRIFYDLAIEIFDFKTELLQMHPIPVVILLRNSSNRNNSWKPDKGFIQLREQLSHQDAQELYFLWQSFKLGGLRNIADLDI